MFQHPPPPLYTTLLPSLSHSLSIGIFLLVPWPYAHLQRTMLLMCVRSKVHDPHQRDGQEGSNCMDMVWSSLTRVDPPAVTVLACNKSGSYVLDHFHPWGATYIPLAGIACFNTPYQRCIGPGAARWTSPLLRYNESFSVPTDPTSAGAAKLIAAAGFGESCPHPVIMPVTNFDPDHQPEGKSYKSCLLQMSLRRTIRKRGALVQSLWTCSRIVVGYSTSSPMLPR